MKDILRVEHLSKSFRLSAKQQRLEKTGEKIRHAVNDVSFSAYRGEIFGLLGPNGAGKTTTMRMLATLLRPDSGDAFLDGASIRTQETEVRSKLAFLTGELKLEDCFTPDYLFNFFSDLHGIDPAVREKRKQALFSRFGIDEFAQTKVANLSQGMKQKVSIVVSIVHDPNVIIFDEPTVGLDPKQILEVRNLIRSLGGKHTVILSTHILAEVQAVCEKIVIIHRGSIIACEKTDELSRVMEDNAHYRYAVCGAQKDVLAALRSVRGVRAAEPTGERDGDAGVYLTEISGGFETRRAIAGALADRGFLTVGVREAGDDLESVFIRLIDRADGAGKKPGKKPQRGANA